MRKLATLVITSLVTMNLTAGYAQAGEALKLPTQEQTTEEGLNAAVGDRAMPHSERVAIQELRAQKAEEEQKGTLKDADSKFGDKLASKNQTSVNLGKPEMAFSGKASYDYSTSHLGAFHIPASIGFLGDSIKLEDGSLWTIHTADRYKVFSWLTTDTVVIVPNDVWLSSYLFKIINQNTGESIQVNLTLGPDVYSIFRYTITTVDNFLGYVWLSDGSYWRTSAFDSSIVAKWLPGDTVIIGVNNGFLHLTNPNILINVNTLTYAASECLIAY